MGTSELEYLPSAHRYVLSLIFGGSSNDDPLVFSAVIVSDLNLHFGTFPDSYRCGNMERGSSQEPLRQVKSDVSSTFNKVILEITGNIVSQGPNNLMSSRANELCECVETPSGLLI